MVGRGSASSGRLGCTQRRKDAEVLGSRGAEDLASLRGGGSRDLPGGAIGCLSPSLLY